MRRGGVLLAGFVLFAGLAGAGPGGPEALLARYRKADSLFHLANETPASDSMALVGFSAIVEELEKRGAGASGAGDTLLTGALLKKGILLDAKGDYARARAAYCRVLGYHPPNDSLVFVTEVLAGTAYYNMDHFDSASYFLLRAEGLAGRFLDHDNTVAMYNTLGALYCDNGNYRQGKNYFDRALGLVREAKKYDTISAVSLQINIATASFRLGQYDEALAIYRQLLFYRPLTDYVYENMGRAYAGMENYPAAMTWFRRVKVEQIPGVLNEMANAELQQHKLDSCEWYLRKFEDFLLREPEKGKPLDPGVTAFYRGAELRERGDWHGALTALQKAIVVFSRNFNSLDVHTNPTSFTGAFAYYRLFDALVRKGEVFVQMGDPAGAYGAYMSALSLLRYIEKSYATDEAKLFLKKESGTAHAEALAVCLQLSRLHPEGDYIDQAFLIGERSKASVITANLEEKAFMTDPGAKGLLEKVNDCKYHIARLNVKIEATKDSGELAAMTKEKEGREMELLRLQQSLEQDGEYYRVKYGDASIGVRDLQRELRGNQALVSLYAAGGALHVFVVTKEGLKHVQLDSLAGLERDVENWLRALKTTENGRRFGGGATGGRLYTRLIAPIQAAAEGKTEWVIVPDGVFALLPWESLYADAEGKQWLVETTTISYRWSSKLLSADGAGATGTGVLAFAPFEGEGDAGNAAGAERFPRLPASKEEIAGLPGEQYYDDKATKERFLAMVNRFPVVHLATHAVSSMDNAAQSFIAFYPAKGNAMDDRLFLEELYGLNLRKTRLVIISACESGQGEVAPQEGVISLARAFAYAGCGSTINSLWKADDRATSAILRQFYVYLQKGETKARALQLAKIDYLKSDAIEKSPAYWAHLVLTGDSGALYPKRDWVLWVVISAGVVLVGGGVWWWKKREKKKSRRR